MINEFKKIKKVTKTVETNILISGNTFNLFKDWIRDTKFSKHKLKIVRMLSTRTFISLIDINEVLKISFPLLAYHVNGNLKNDGLVKSGFVIKKTLKYGRTGLKLTSFGCSVLRIVDDVDDTRINFK